MEYTFSMLNDRLAVKQAELSKKRAERPPARQKRDTARRILRAEYKRLWLIIKTANPGITATELKVQVEGDDGYQVAWAEEILAQAAYEKIDVETQNLEDEIATLEDMGNNLSREAKLERYGT